LQDRVENIDGRLDGGTASLRIDTFYSRAVHIWHIRYKYSWIWLQCNGSTHQFHPRYLCNKIHSIHSASGELGKFKFSWFYSTADNPIPKFKTWLFNQDWDIL